MSSPPTTPTSDAQDQPEDDNSGRKYVVAAGIATAAVGGVATVALAPLVVAAAGFGAGGIAAGSLGASMMSSAATSGFGMAAVSALQSAGAAGIGASTNILIGASGAAAAGSGGTGIAAYMSKLLKHRNQNDSNNGNGDGNNDEPKDDSNNGNGDGNNDEPKDESEDETKEENKNESKDKSKDENKDESKSWPEVECIPGSDNDSPSTKTDGSQISDTKEDTQLKLCYTEDQYVTGKGDRTNHPGNSSDSFDNFTDMSQDSGIPKMLRPGDIIEEDDDDAQALSVSTVAKNKL